MSLQVVFPAEIDAVPPDRNNQSGWPAVKLFLLGVMVLWGVITSGRAEGLSWPPNQLTPTFAPPATSLDCIDISSAGNAQADLFASLEGIVNRTQPRIACVTSADGEGKFTWLNLHNLRYTLISGYSAILKYRTNVTGLVVTDPNQPDTLNLATTMAGISNALICDPSLLFTLTNAPYSLPVVSDLRGRFANKYQVYDYLYSNCWAQCTHRIVTGLYTNLHGNFRDYIVAVRAANVWLDPGNVSDAALLGKFMADVTPGKSIYMGWWPDEGNGLNWIAQYGVPVLASDYFCNGSVYSGVIRPVNVSPIPPPPPLENKVYVSLILSDGDNIQYMQHAMVIRWNDPARGSIPIGWTATPLAAAIDPTLLNFYRGTATTNDCLISGPSGAGYAHIENWNAANLSLLTQLTEGYLQHSGLRIITIWDRVTSGVARAFATNCPSLLGLTDQSGGTYSTVSLGLRTMGLTVTYSSSTNDIISGITNAARNWNGTSPMFLAVQANVWNLTPTDLRHIASALDPQKYQVVRPDHLFLLYNRVFASPEVVTRLAMGITAGTAGLRASVVPHAVTAIAWFEWGTNTSYGNKTVAFNVGGAATPLPVNGLISGLVARTGYHYRVAASNALGVVWGADQMFTTGNRLQAWGDGSEGETNLPPGTNFVAVSCGANHALGLKNDGTVVAWGRNDYGQTNVPAGLSGVVAVAGGIQHSLALRSDGTVVAWGDNTYGETNVPAGLSNVIAIAAGGYHSLALTGDHTVVAWGYNNLGQTNVPAGLSNVVEVAAGYAHNLALKSDGTIVAWGYNNLGQVNVPAGLDHVAAVAAGQYHSTALRTDVTAATQLFPVSQWVADSLTESNGAPVGIWADVMGGKTAVQSDSGKQPQVYAGALNGHNVVRFSAAAQQHLTVAATNSPMSGANDFTLVLVFQAAAPGDVSGSFYENTGLLGCEQPNAVPDWALGLSGSELVAGLGAGATSCSADVGLYGGNGADGKPHVAMYVRSGSVVRLYVDGVVVASQNALCTGARGSYDFQIGAMTDTSHFFAGDIAEIQIYNRALGLTEIPQLHRSLALKYHLADVAGAMASRWTADSVAGSNGSAVSNWVDQVSGVGATQTVPVREPKLYSAGINGHKVLRFAGGSSQYLTVKAADSPISSAGSFTLALVFKTTSPGNSSSSFYNNTGLLGAEQSGVVADWALCLNGAQLGAGLGGGASGCGSDLSLYGGNVTDGKPHIALYVRSGETLTLYVDGIMVARQTGLCTAARGNYDFLIGGMTTSSYFFTGDIAEIQIYNRGLDADEIAEVNETLADTYGIGGAAGRVVMWGNIVSGLGSVPSGLEQTTALASGNAFNLAVSAKGSVSAWGSDSAGQTEPPAGLTNVTAVAAGAAFGVAIGNQIPAAADVTVSGFADQDLVVTLPAASPEGNPSTVQLLTLATAGTLYQYDNGNRGTLINVGNSAVTDGGGRVIFVPAAGETGEPYASFTFRAEDAWYVSAAATAIINIQPLPPPEITGTGWSGGSPGSGSFILHFAGGANVAYTVWASTNLVDWQALGPATETGAGQYEFSDATTGDWPQRFYRISAGP